MTRTNLSTWIVTLASAGALVLAVGCNSEGLSIDDSLTPTGGSAPGQGGSTDATIDPGGQSGGAAPGQPTDPSNPPPVPGDPNEPEPGDPPPPGGPGGWPGGPGSLGCRGLGACVDNLIGQGMTSRDAIQMCTPKAAPGGAAKFLSALGCGQDACVSAQYCKRSPSGRIRNLDGSPATAGTPCGNCLWDALAPLVGEPCSGSTSACPASACTSLVSSCLADAQ